jgi:uncharacterized protein (DUF58 family)
MSILARSELVDPQLFDAARRLHLSARRVAPQGRFADQRSRDRGMGLEFEDHRPYTPGDDLRAVDWHLERRLGRLFVRLYEQQEDLPLYLLPDVSRSQFLEDPPRGRAGLRATVLLAAASLFQHDTVGVFPFAEDLSILARPASGRNRAVTLASRLAALEAGGATDIPKAIARLSALRLRRGLVVLVSDLFDPQGIEAVTKAFGRLRHRLLVVQLTRPVDADPGLAGDLRLVDCESGAMEDVSITPAVQERYRQAYGAFETHITDFCRERGIGRIRLDCDQDVVPQLTRVFHAGGFQA